MSEIVATKVIVTWTLTDWNADRSCQKQILPLFSSILYSIGLLHCHAYIVCNEEKRLLENDEKGLENGWRNGRDGEQTKKLIW